MFRILVVDDELATAHLLLTLAKELHHEHEFVFVYDGVAALEYLRGCEPHSGVPRPDLILLDMNMPRLDGLATLKAIKSDPQLRLIPVIILSTAGAPELVRKSYEAHANCYVLKPADLDRTRKFIQALEAFWMDFVIRPVYSDGPLKNLQEGSKKGDTSPEGRALHRDEPFGPQIAANHAEQIRLRVEVAQGSPVKPLTCPEHNRLMEGLAEAVRELLELHQQQFRAIVEEDSEINRFDLLIHMANERKQQAKYAYIRHVESHGC